MKKSVLYLFLLVMAVAAVSCGHSSGGLSDSSDSATLEWTAPTENSDGSALTDLAGYKVHYGTSSGSYSQSRDVGNVTTCQVTGLASGSTYYFVVTAYNRAGVEGEPTTEGSKAIN